MKSIQNQPAALYDVVMWYIRGNFRPRHVLNFESLRSFAKMNLTTLKDLPRRPMANKKRAKCRPFGSDTIGKLVVDGSVKGEFHYTPGWEMNKVSPIRAGVFASTECPSA